MAQHFLASAAEKTFTPWHVMNMSDEEVFQKFQLLRWGSLDEQACPWCGVIDNHEVRRHRKQWSCKSCDKSFSVTSNSLFADRKLPLKTILLAFAYYVNSAKGIAALQLARFINVTPRTAAMLLGKLREALVIRRHTEKLTGVVHVDGAHFCAKPRRANRRTKMTNEEAQGRLASRKQAIYRTPNDKRNFKRRMESRRIVMVYRSVHQEKGKGGYKTIVSICRSENEADAMSLATRYVSADALIMSDEAPAFNRFGEHWEHEVVCHAEEYSTPEGVNENQAESFYSRLRRAEYGVFHRTTPTYLMDYACEMAWREDTRRTDSRSRLFDLMGKIFSLGLSQWWRGYHQGHRRGDELLLI